MSRSQKLKMGRALAAAIAVSTGVAGSCRTVPRCPARSVPSSPPSVEALVPPPIMRIGVLTEASRASIGADAGVRLSATAADGRHVERELPRATFVPVAAGSSSPRYRIQVASSTSQAAAREAGKKAEQAFGLSSAVAWSDESRTHQVRLGDFASRDEAQPVLERVQRSDYPGAWIAPEAGDLDGGRIRLLETGDELASALVIPVKPDELSVDATSYRGLAEVRASEGGLLTVVNVLNLEDYLKGVVPNELSPAAYGEIEALKAQAVAARTYALRNRGQYQARGYDLCATAACQVYRGRATEHPLSTQAVEDTRGLAARYRTALINSLYTSTCGGHTEDGNNIFDGESAPYLKGVACGPEREGWFVLRSQEPPREIKGGETLSRDAALLVALGVLEPRAYAPAALQGFASEDELAGWTGRLVAALGRRDCEPRVERPLNRRGTLFGNLVSAVCWDEHARRLLAPGDQEYLLQVEDRSELSDEAERRAATLLTEEGVLAPLSDNTLRPNAAVTRAQAVSLLARLALRLGGPSLVSGSMRGLRPGEIVLETDGESTTHPLDPNPRLFRTLGGPPLAASELNLASGDAVRVVLKEGRVVFVEGEQNRLGASADRSSRYYRWDVRLTPDAVAKAVARYGSVGSVRDVVPRRLGVSGRVVEAAIVGSEGELHLEGLRVRWGLGLRENLFVVDRQLDRNGRVEHFLFSGKGWGHGVGLCQVGAFGLAQAGRSYDQILKHYYTGITIDKAY